MSLSERIFSEVVKSGNGMTISQIMTMFSGSGVCDLSLALLALEKENKIIYNEKNKLIIPVCQKKNCVYLKTGR